MSAQAAGRIERKSPERAATREWVVRESQVSRALYIALIHLHPPAFRRQFSGEMIWVFEEARQSEGAFNLVTDAFASLLRQWLLRNGTWKVAVAVVGGLIWISTALLVISPP